MKTFEEKYTAWVDGKLTGRELADFENEIAAKSDAQSAQSDKLAAQKVGDLMRTFVHAPELRNADFFNHQLMQQIEAGQTRSEAREPHREKRAWSFWTLPRMAWAGATLAAPGLPFRFWLGIDPARAPLCRHRDLGIRGL